MSLFGYWILAACLVISCSAAPASQDAGSETDGPNPVVIGISVVLVLCFVSAVALCTCCQDELFGMKSLDDAASTYSGIEPPNRSTPGSPNSERHAMDNSVTIEPLPDMSHRRPSATGRPHPPGFTHRVNKGIYADDWFGEGKVQSIARSNLQYVNELGKGWFGHVVEGEVSKLFGTSRRVVVKILREDISSVEQTYFLDEARVYKDVKHPNILELFGACLDTDPYLLIFDFCALGNLKSYLSNNRGNADSLIQSNTLFSFAYQACAGLTHMQEKGFVHNDFACRNLLLDSNGTLKVGNYGISAELFKEDYIVVGDCCVPVRWWAPETFAQAKPQLITRDVTHTANVWSFGVVLWEMLEFGKQPYMELSTEQVVARVIQDGRVRLPEPLTPIPKRDKFYHLMHMCWKPGHERPRMVDLLGLLTCLHQQQTSDAHESTPDFDRKWDALLQCPTPTTQHSTTSPTTSAVPAQKHVSVDLFESPVPPDPPATVASPSPFPLVDTTPHQIQGAASYISTDPLTPAEPIPIPPTATATAAPIDETQEKNEKRQFVLTLSDEDLANLTSEELLDFYEYLSAGEIHALEQRHANAREQAELAVRKRQASAHAQKLLTLADSELAACDQKEIAATIALLAGAEREQLLANLARIEKRRQHVLGSSDESLLALDEATYQSYVLLLSPDEQGAVEERRLRAEELQGEQERKRQHLLSLQALDLFGESESPEFKESLELLSPQEKATVELRLGDVKAIRDHLLYEEIVDVSSPVEDLDRYLRPDELADYSRRRNERELQNMIEILDTHYGYDFHRLYQTLTPAQRDLVPQPLQQRATKIADMRAAILSMPELKLCALSPQDLGEHMATLSEDEKDKIRELYADAVDRRRAARMDILEASGLRLHDLVMTGNALDAYLPYLSEQEAAEVRKRANEVVAQREKLLAQPELTADMNDEDLNEYLRPEEALNVRAAQQALAGAQQIESDLLDADDLQLLQLRESDQWESSFSALSQEEQHRVQSKLAELDGRRREILEIADPKLAAYDSWEAVALLYEPVLSADELERVENAYDAARREREQRRNTILGAEGRELFQLAQAGLDGYYCYLNHDEIGAVERRLEDVRMIRERLLGADSAAESDEPQSDLELQIDAYLTESEQENYRGRREQQKDRRRSEILGAQGVQLVRLYKDQWDDYFPYLSVEERAGVVQWVDQINTQRDRFLNLEDAALATVPPEQIEAARKYFTDEEFGTLKSRWDALQVAREQLREQLLLAEGAELFQLAKGGLEPYYGLLSEEEMMMVVQKVDVIGQKRREILSANGEQLALSDWTEQYALLSAEEKESVDKLKADYQAGSQEKLKIETQDMQSPLNLEDLKPKNASTPMPSTGAKAIATRLPSITADLADGEYEPMGTPKLRDEYAERRSIILNAEDEDLKRIPMQEIEDYYQCLTAEEIFTLKERLDRIRGEITAGNPPKRRLQEASSSFSHSLLSSADSLRLLPEHAGSYSSPWKAREAILAMDGQQLLSGGMDDFYGYLTMEEIAELEGRIDEARAKNKSNLVFATDAELQAMSAGDLERSINLLSPEDQDQVQRRMQRIALLPSLSYGSGSEQVQDISSGESENFKKYLAMTQISSASVATTGGQSEEGDFSRAFLEPTDSSANKAFMLTPGELSASIFDAPPTTPLSEQFYSPSQSAVTGDSSKFETPPTDTEKSPIQAKNNVESPKTPTEAKPAEPATMTLLDFDSLSLAPPTPSAANQQLVDLFDDFGPLESANSSAPTFVEEKQAGKSDQSHESGNDNSNSLL